MVACGSTEGDGDRGNSNAGGSEPAGDGSGNADGDCLTDGEEAELGTDPASVDSDRDGVSDCDELACVSDPSNGAEKCYACGWKHNDPGTLVSSGTSVGSAVANATLTDQCGEVVELWDFAQEYHILYQTSAW